MEQAYLYLRVSTTGQVEGYGFDRQEEACRAYAKKAGYDVAGVYLESVSGAKDETERPAFQEMMAAILANGVKTIIIESMDRLARELRIQETLLIYLASKAIDLISARTEENITQAVKDDPMKLALVQIQGVFAQLEKNQLVRRLRKGREKARKEGQPNGRKPYGATPEEEKIVQRIRAMRRTRRNGTPGMTLQQIADRLNAEGVPTRSAQRGYREGRAETWKPAHVFGVLGKKRKEAIQ